MALKTLIAESKLMKFLDEYVLGGNRGATKGLLWRFCQPLFTGCQSLLCADTQPYKTFALICNVTTSCVNSAIKISFVFPFSFLKD